MSEQQPLSTDAIRILKDIHTRGLIVLWSFRVPHPRYADNDDKMPHSDWLIANRELWYEKEVPVSMGGVKYKSIDRIVIRNRQLIREHVEVYDTDKELITELKILDDALPAGELDRTVELSETITQDSDNAWSWQWSSDYIQRERIENDSYFEEFIGLESRYALTPFAIELIGGG